MEIQPGLHTEIEHVVTEQETAASYGSGLVPVLSTPHLIALMESAARAVVAPYLAEGQTTVGTHVNMRHLAATPVGMKVRIKATLTEAKGRRLHFSVEAFDEVERIGEAEHERFIIDTERFMRRVREKAGARGV